MSERPSRPSSPYLEPPRKSVELEDSGAQDSVASSDEEHFSDASEGHQRSYSRSASGRTSPVPLTRVEKVDGSPAYGEVPGTDAYGKRERDAVPDEVEVVPEGSRSRSHSSVGLQDHPSTPGGTLIPQTLVEKVDPDTPSHGEVPGTPAYEQRKADAVPDSVMKMSESDSRPPSHDTTPTQSSSDSTPVPETLLSRVDSMPSEGAESGVRAHKRSPSDALPDSTERISDPPQPQDPSTNRSHTRRRSTLTRAENPDGTLDRGLAAPMSQEPMDDFDDFAQEQEMDEDDFGDFDDGFQGPGEIAADEAMDEDSMRPQQPPTPPSVPLVELNPSQTVSDLLASLQSHLDNLFPASKDASSLPPVEPIPNPSAIFSTDRSLSLWSQLVAPPPLQPQNWVKSRIRRLFLVSLGVPVDLDEILPASKQKKLILPSINPDGSTTVNPVARSPSQARRERTSQDHTNSPSTSTSGRHRTSRRREPTPPPHLDLSAVRRLCLTTDAALNGLTDAELTAHVHELERATQRASVVLEYWLKRRDGLVSEKEAFEGVIENLVNHARRVRK